MDLSLLRRLMGDDEQMLNHFVSIFKEQVPGQIASLTRLCEDEEWEELSITIHSLKTQFNYVGLTEFADRMLSVEEQIDGGETNTVSLQLHFFISNFKLFWEREFSAELTKK